VKRARYRRTRWREAIVGIALLVLAALRIWTGDDTDIASRGRYNAGELKPGVYEVERVVDGDTLLLKERRLRVRLQGVDTPETVKENTPVEPWGPEASEYTKAFIREARGRVRVDVDGEPRDQHGRHLAFIWHGDRLLNEELVRQGLARPTLQYDFSQSKKDLLRRADQAARRDAVGRWSR
jgi:micrococcal nuclease